MSDSGVAGGSVSGADASAADVPPGVSPAVDGAPVAGSPDAGSSGGDAAPGAAVSGVEPSVGAALGGAGDGSPGGGAAGEDLALGVRQPGGPAPAVTSPETVAGLGGQAASADGVVPLSDVGAGVTVAGVNSADGAPALVDPGYVDASDVVSTAERNRLVNDLRADGSATDAERSSGERTLTSAGAADGGGPVAVSDLPAVDAELVGMATAARFRPVAEVRAVLMDRPFVTSDGEGGPGDYLAEDDSGRRFVVSAAELASDYRPL